MRRSFSAAFVIPALLVVYLGAPCLASAATHTAMPMDDTSSAPCEGSAAASEALCAAPDTYAPLQVGTCDLPALSVGTIPSPTPPPVAIAPVGMPRPVPILQRPLYLLHTSLLT